jgi:hypothetical protein
MKFYPSELGGDSNLSVKRRSDELQRILLAAHTEGAVE